MLDYRLDFRTSDWSSFCGGAVVFNFVLNNYRGGDKKEDHNDVLRRIADSCPSSFVMADQEEGVADSHIFEKLFSEGVIDVEGREYNLRYTLSSYFFNTNSGNMVRILTVWKEYTEDCILKAQQGDDGEYEYEYEDEDEDED